MEGPTTRDRAKFPGREVSGRGTYAVSDPSGSSCVPRWDSPHIPEGAVASAAWRTGRQGCHNGQMINPADIDTSDLLSRWRGPARLPALQLAEYPPDLPAPLSEWYALTSCWPEVRSAGTRIYDPSRIRMDADRVAFMEDSTGDWIWMFDSNQPDVVYEGEPGGGLNRTTEELAELLVHATVRSVILLSGFGRLGAQVPDEALSQILDPMESVGFGGWKWPRPGYRIFASDRLLAEVGPAVDLQAPWRSRAGYSAVRIAGLSDSDLTYVDSLSKVTWADSGLNI